MGRISDILKTNMKIDLENTKKQMTDNEREYWKKVNEDSPKQKVMSLDQVIKSFNYYTKRIDNFVIDESNKNVIRLMQIYFSQDSKTMQNKFPQYSTNKGLLITGKCGTGKTLLFNIFKKIIQHSPLMAFSMTSSNRVVGEYDTKGSQSLKPYMTRKYLFDDFGSENKGKHYGKDEEVFTTLLEERYINFQDNGLKTHLTSNLTINQIRQRYGDRVHSRLFEMFNIIVLDGHDRRV